MRKFKMALMPLFLIVLFFVTSCCQDKDVSKKATVAEISDDTESFTDPKFQLKSDPITVDAAAKIMRDFLKINLLQNIGKHKAFGGEFDADLFQIDTAAGNIGVLLWFCYNPYDPRYPEFFLALEQVTKYDSINGLMYPGSSLSVASPFLYSKDDNKFETIKDYIINHESSDVNLINRTINQAKTIEFVDNFKRLMASVSPNSTTNLYCKFPFAFFKNNVHFDKFMKRNPALVRYYFGLAVDTDHKPNYIRPILVGVSAAGYPNINSSYPIRDDDDGLLQKSSPPPPYNP